MPLPRSALLAVWLGATLRGRIGPDEFADAVRDEDPHHLVVGWPGQPDPVPLTLLPAVVRGHRPTAITVAVPVPGDPVGLAGPPGFNAEALDAGEAAVVAGPPGQSALGLVPRLDARTLLWEVHPAVAPRLLDPDEAARTLRATLVATTAELARLDVASWQPDVADLILDLHRRAPLSLPPGTAAGRIDGIERADLCREIVALALQDQGGAATAQEVAARQGCLTDLDRAARRTLAACCSDSLGST